MSSTVNGSVDRGVSGGSSVDPGLDSEWRDTFVRGLAREPRFPGPSRFLPRDIAFALGQSIHRDASVLEAGVGNGRLLAALPNEVRWGIDVLPEAIERAEK